MGDPTGQVNSQNVQDPSSELRNSYRDQQGYKTQAPNRTTYGYMGSVLEVEKVISVHCLITVTGKRQPTLSRDY